MADIGGLSRQGANTNQVPARRARPRGNEVQTEYRLPRSYGYQPRAKAGQDNHSGGTLFGGAPEGEAAFIFSDVILTPGDRLLTEENPSTDFLIEERLLDWNAIEYFSAADATGRIFKMYLHRFPTVQRLLRRLKRKKSPQ